MLLGERREIGLLLGEIELLLGEVALLLGEIGLRSGCCWVIWE